MAWTAVTLRRFLRYQVRRSMNTAASGLTDGLDKPPDEQVERWIWQKLTGKRGGALERIG